MKYPFKNLIFEGGGVKGIGYVGALKALEDRKIIRNVSRVGGTSAGAINAVLLALGFSLKEIPDGHPKSPTYGHLKIPHPSGPIS